MTTLELIQYYANLLIMQYLNKTRASATIKTQVTPVVMPQTSVQLISFSDIPTSGTFKVAYDEDETAALAYNISEADLQTAIRGLDGLADVVVLLAPSYGSFTVYFYEVTPPADLLELTDITLQASSTAVTYTNQETDVTLPIAVVNGFNLLQETDQSLAVGVQLDVIGKYAGVTRYGRGFTTNIELNDADFRSLIRMAIIKNSAGSSLAEIQQLIHDFFPNQMLVFDYQNMSMSYLISTSVGSQELVQLFVTQGLLPRPMAVQVALIIYAPDIFNFFGFRTYAAPAFNASPFNDYADYQMDWPWLSYSNAINV